MAASPRLNDLLGKLFAPGQNVCHLCGTLLFRREQYLCEDCWRGLEGCRIPILEAPAGDNPPLTASYGAYWFDGEARALIHRLKFASDLAAAQPLIHGLAALYAQCRERLPLPDIVAPVPAHLSRLRSRGYNQAEVLARGFCAQTGLCCRTDGLIRVHHLSSQVDRGKEERLSAMKGAFEAKESFAGMNVLLVDDVLTTGATATACGECMIRAGAKRVDLLVCAKA